MASITITDLCCGRQNQTVCVSVARLWHFRGGLECSPIKLIHLVIIDEQTVQHITWQRTKCSYVIIFMMRVLLSYGNDGYAVVSTSFVGAYLHIL